jgi:hypothetical protein
MTIRSSKDVPFFLVGGYDCLGSMTQFSDKAEAMTEDTHTLGDTWREVSYTGLRSAELTQEGFFEDGAGSVHTMLSTGPGVARTLCYGLEGTATGARFVGWEGAMQVNYERSFTLGTLEKAKATYKSNGPVDEGRILRTFKNAAATGASTGTPVDGGASSTGGVGYLQWNAVNNQEANVRILHSSDDVTYSALFTFAKLSGSGYNAERLTTTGTIERYTAVDITTASATGNITVLNLFVGLARGLTS